MLNHTPGPWQLARFNFDRATVEVETAERGDDLPDQGCFIALVGAYGASIDDAPDARLIAAAPDLLAALEDAEFFLRKAAICNGDARAMIDSLKRSAAAARAAIDKARGTA